MTPLEVLLSRLHRVRRLSSSRWTAACPGPNHRRGDRTPSLSIRETASGVVLLHCWAGDRLDEILTAIDLTVHDLFPASRATQQRARPQTRRSPLDEARREILRAAGVQYARLAPYRELNAESDSIRTAYRLIARARQIVTALGGEDDGAWDLLTQAAWLEVATLNAEARLDDELAARLPSALPTVDVVNATCTIRVDIA